MNRAIFGLLLTISTLCNPARAIEPADPQLIPEGRALLSYMHSIYGKQVLSGIAGPNNLEKVVAASGKTPAILSLDLSGWNTPRWGPTYTPVVQRTIQTARAWHARGGIVAMQFHWKHPLKEDGTAWIAAHGAKPPSGPFDMAAALRPGTPEHQAFIQDLDRHANYLKLLANARIPVLWRPFHEIDGGWFWWTDLQNPENSAAVWRMTFDHLVHKRQLHNLIWVYSAALKAGNMGKDNVDAVDYRRRFYPGERFVDIAGIDIYPNDWYGWKDSRHDAYRRAFDFMSKVAPGKMLALSECQAVPNPDLMRAAGPRWLYVLPWWAGNDKNPDDWVRQTYTHDLLITLDQLPPTLRTAPAR